MSSYVLLFADTGVCVNGSERVRAVDMQFEHALLYVHVSGSLV